MDSEGNAYVTGSTGSLDFPVTSGAAETIHKGEVNGFLVKISPTGDRLTYASFLGGTGGDVPRAIAVDGTGNVYLTGYAGSKDFPVTVSAAQSSLKQNCTVSPATGYGTRFNQGDAFVAKFNTTISQFVYVTYLGGACGEEGLGVAVDRLGGAFVVGVTDSPDFPVSAGALRTDYGSGNVTGFLTKFTPEGLVEYSTFIGGAGENTAEAVALDANGGIYITGSTFGFDQLQFSGPRQVYGLIQFVAAGNSTNPGFPLFATGAAYALKLNPNGTRRYLQTVGGSFGEGRAIAVDAKGRCWIGGATQQYGFVLGDFTLPLVHPFQAKTGNNFVAQLSSEGSVLFSSLADSVSALAVDRLGNAFLVGTGKPTTVILNPFFIAQDAASLTRIDVDIESAVTIEEPQNLYPVLNPTAPFNSAVPGEFMVVTGSGLGPENEVSGNLAASAAGTRVTLDGVAAPLLSVQSGRIAFLVPFGINRNRPTQFQVESDRGVSNSIRLGTDYANPSAMSVANANATVNTAEQPAAAGSTVTIYAAGFGQTDPPGVDGATGTFLPRSFPELQFDFLVEKKQVEVLYLGGAPGQESAVTQINLRVPATLAAGPHRIQLGTRRKEAKSRQRATIAISRLST